MTDWLAHAACTGAPDSVFYPHEPADPDHEERRERGRPAADYRLARSYCQGLGSKVPPCPVRAECASYVMTFEQGLSEKHRYGMYAGMTPRERARLDPKTYQNRMGRT